MSDETQPCPQCNSPYGYFDGSLYVCPECFHEWSLEASSNAENKENQFLDAHGNTLQSGDTVKTTKELKVGKGTLKAGTKVKNIRLLDEPVNGHDIACKSPDLGSFYLKCSVVKKA